MRRRAFLSFAALAGATALGFAPAEPHDAAWVSHRLQEWQLTAKDRSWESIGWAKDLKEALWLGREHDRPIFLFTHDGRLNVGRC